MTTPRSLDTIIRCSRCGDRLGLQYARLCWCSCGAVCVQGREVVDERP